MGQRLSLNNQKASPTEIVEVSQIEACKSQRTSSSFWDENPRLFPGLPDEISIQILARLPRIWHLNAKQVSRSWKAVITSGEIYRLRKELGITEEWLYILTTVGNYKHVWYALDPVSQLWQRLPPMPNLAAEDGSRFADAIKGWLGLKDMWQNLYCGCAICAVNGCLYVLGGFSKLKAMRSVWRYDPRGNSWSKVAPMCTGRAYCKTNVLNDKLYVVGGLTMGRAGVGLIPLQCAEVFDPCSGTWTEIPSMPFSKARALPTPFPSGLLEPIVTGMTSYRGKLYVRQSLYCRPLIDAGGEVYDPESNSWFDMPTGMTEGWPARQSDTQLSLIVNEELYTLNPSNSVDNARIEVYDHQDDAWKAIEGGLPDRNLTDSMSPYLFAGFLGKLHVITKDVNHNISVMQADRLNQFASSPSSASIGESSRELSEAVTRSPESIWKVIASRHARSDELVGCLILQY